MEFMDVDDMLAEFDEELQNWMGEDEFRATIDWD